MRPRLSSPSRPVAACVATLTAGLVLLGLGRRLTAETAAAANVSGAPADYVPEDDSPPPPTVDPLGQADAAPRSSGPTAPLDFLRVTSSYGMRRHPILGFTRMHQGVDFAAKEGAPVLAAADGVVTEAGLEGGYGNLLRIRHAGGWATGYAHLSAFAAGVRVGMVVSRGQVVAFVGHTGLATGPHLHYEVSLNGVKLDPMQTPFGGAPATDPHAGAYQTASYLETSAPAPPPATGVLTLRGPLRADAPGA
ncbi:MAG TPA: M23 family metallopeptidase [Caulobacteraceae bacterium]|nr:M23 family metallopeptidase [Caulobacteraceae bacterium]